MAVLDIGKTNLKLCIVDGRGAIQRSYRRPNVVRPGPPYPHHDVDGIWTWITDALRDVTGRTRIDAIVTTTHGATVALLDGDRLALPVMDYEFDGLEDASEVYERVCGSFADTCSPRLPVGLNLGRQVFWQERTFPDAFVRATHTLAYPQYWSCVAFAASLPPR